MRMKRAFKNAVILESHDLEPTKGYLVVEDGFIKDIGHGRAPFKNALDMKGGIIAPAFTNAHLHLGDSIAQDLGAYEPLINRVGKGGLKFKLLAEKTRELRDGIRASLREMLLSGTTSFCDFRESGSMGVKLLRSIVKDQEAVIMGRPDGEERAEEVLDYADGIGISGIADYDSKELREMAAAAKREGKLLGIHAGEIEDDLKKALALKPDFVVHATNASAESLDACAKARVPIVLCARANAMGAVGLPPLSEIFSGVTVALGTDNVMINSPNMLREMEFVFKSLRGMSRDHAFQAKEVLLAATLNGRKILGLGDNALIAGNRANFIIFKWRKYIYDPILAIIHRYEADDIRGIVFGEKLFRR